jgi:hypothetical protein
LQLWRDLRIHRGTPRPRPRGTRARRAVGWRVPRSPGSRLTGSVVIHSAIDHGASRPTVATLEL